MYVCAVIYIFLGRGNEIRDKLSLLFLLALASTCTSSSLITCFSRDCRFREWLKKMGQYTMKHDFQDGCTCCSPFSGPEE